MSKEQKKLMKKAQELMDLPLPDTFEEYAKRGFDITSLLVAAGDTEMLAALERFDEKFPDGPTDPEFAAMESELREAHQDALRPIH